MLAQTTTTAPAQTVPPETPEQKRKRLELERKQKAEQLRQQKALELKRKQEEAAKRQLEQQRQQEEKKRALQAEIRRKQELAAQEAAERQRHANERRRNSDLEMQRRAAGAQNQPATGVAPAAAAPSAIQPPAAAPGSATTRTGAASTLPAATAAPGTPLAASPAAAANPSVAAPTVAPATAASPQPIGRTAAGAAPVAPMPGVIAPSVVVSPSAPAATIALPMVPGSPSPGQSSNPGPTLSGTTVPLRWSAVSGAVDYDVGVRDLTTNALVVDQRVAGTSLTLNLVAGRLYRWNVAACNQAGCSAFTAPLNFVVKEGNPPITGTTSTTAAPVPTTTTPTTAVVAPTPTATPTPTLAAPAPTTMAAATAPAPAPAPAIALPAVPAGLSPGQTSSPGPTLSGTTVPLRWNTVNGATDYDLGVRDLTTNALVVDQRVVGNTLTLNLVAGRSYRWNIAACNQAGCSAFTAPLNFVVKEGSPPITGTTSTTAAPAPAPTTTSPTASVAAPITTATPTPTLAAPAPTTMAAAPAPAIALPSVPAGLSPGQTSSPGPTLSGTTVPLRWNTVDGATNYDLGVRDLTTNALVVDQRVAGNTLTLNLVAGRSYRWNIAACNQAGCSAFTAPLNFVVKEANPPITGTTSTTAAPAPTTTSPTTSTTTAATSPAPTTTTALPSVPGGLSPGQTSSPGPTQSGTSVALKWNAVTGAKNYDLGVRDLTTGTFVYSQRVTGSTFTAANLVAGRTYRWNLAACSDAGCSDFATPVHFTMAAAPAPAVTTSTTKPAVPTGLLPGAVVSPGTSLSGTSTQLKWSAVTGAKDYDLGVRDLTTNALVVDQRVAVPSFSLGNLVVGRTYRWNLAACNDAGCSDFTAPLFFTVATASITQASSTPWRGTVKSTNSFKQFDQKRTTDLGLYVSQAWAETPVDNVPRWKETCLSAVYAMIEHARGRTSYRIGAVVNGQSNWSDSVGAVAITGASTGETAVNFQSIREQMAAGNPVILVGPFPGGTHKILAIGIDQNEFIIANDPWGGAQLKIDPSTWRTSSTVTTNFTITRMRMVKF